MRRDNQRDPSSESLTPVPPWVPQLAKPIQSPFFSCCFEMRFSVLQTRILTNTLPVARVVCPYREKLQWLDNNNTVVITIYWKFHLHPALYWPFRHIISFNSYNTFQVHILLFPCFRGGNCRSERFSNLLKITQLVYGRAGIWNQGLSDVKACVL